jgi:hypothetical protein
VGQVLTTSHSRYNIFMAVSSSSSSNNSNTMGVGSALRTCTSHSFKIFFLILVLVSTVLRSFHLYLEEQLGNTEQNYETLETHRKVVLNSLGSCGGGLKGGECYTHSLRLLNYCALSLPDGVEGNNINSANSNNDISALTASIAGSSSNNGLGSGVQFNNKDEDFELVHVSVTIRHGDRSAIHKIPNSENRFDASSSRASILDSHATMYTPRVASSFAVNVLKADHTPIADTLQAELSSAANNNKPSAEIFRALNPASLFRTPDRDLTPGQLTSVGFMQHVHLGFLLHKAYSPLITAISDPSQIYIRSTNYARTIQSVSALVSTMLPNIGGSGGQIPVNVYLDESDEIMHGIGLKSSSHVVTATGEQVLKGSCNKAARLQQQEREAFETSVASTTTIESLFGTDAAHRVRLLVCLHF